MIFVNLSANSIQNKFVYNSIVLAAFPIFSCELLFHYICGRGAEEDFLAQRATVEAEEGKFWEYFIANKKFNCKRQINVLYNTHQKLLN